MFLIFASILSLFAISCAEDGSIATEQTGAVFYGRVTDESGNPVQGVSLHYMPYLSDSLIGKQPATGVINIAISFSLPMPANVTLFVISKFTRETVKSLLNNVSMSAGFHSFSFDADNLTNGFYSYILKYDTTNLEGTIILLRSLEELISANPLATSDANGNFSLPYKNLGLGYKFPYTSEVSPEIIGYKTVTNQFELMFYKSGYMILKEIVTIDTNQTMKKSFVMRRI